MRQNRRQPGIWRCRVRGPGIREGASSALGKKITGLVGSVGGHEQLSGGWGADRDDACAAAGWPSPAEERAGAECACHLTNPSAVLADLLAVLPVLSAVVRLARIASLSFREPFLMPSCADTPLPRVGCAVREVRQGPIDHPAMIDDGVNVYTAIVLAAFVFLLGFTGIYGACTMSWDERDRPLNMSWH